MQAVLQNLGLGFRQLVGQLSGQFDRVQGRGAGAERGGEFAKVRHDVVGQGRAFAFHPVRGRDFAEGADRTGPIPPGLHQPDQILKLVGLVTRDRRQGSNRQIVQRLATGTQLFDRNLLSAEFGPRPEDFQTAAPDAIEVRDDQRIRAGGEVDQSLFFRCAVPAIVVHDQLVSDIESGAVVGAGREGILTGLLDLDHAGKFQPIIIAPLDLRYVGAKTGHDSTICGRQPVKGFDSRIGGAGRKIFDQQTAVIG